MLKQLLAFFAIVLSLYTQAQAPNANFTVSSTTVCVGVPITFTNTSTTNGGSAIALYSWDFGDGVPLQTQNATHTYATEGIKTVTLVVTNATGQADFEVKTITVLPSPTASFSVLGASCTIPLSLTFNNSSSSGAGYSYNWTFGNGSPAFNGANPPSQTYNSAGNYQVILTVTNTSNGCIAKDTQNVVVSNYQAGIIVPTSACVGQPVQFQDNSTAGANNWSWNFGGLGTSSDQNPTFSFSAAGTYTIQLASQNTVSGCSGSASQQITVQPTPTPSFAANQTTNCAPANIQFTNNSVGGVSYTWNFGNGVTYTGANPPSQSYLLDTSYTVSLTMTTASGCTGTTILNNYITLTGLDPTFTASVTGGCDPLTVHFTNTTVAPNPSNPIVSYAWNFGNGQTFNGPNPPNQIYQIGIYDVTLTVTAQSGCSGSVVMDDYITVGHINSINFSVDTLVNCIKNDFHFTSNVVTNPVVTDSTEISYNWDFTEGNSTDPNPTYQFTSDTGYFDVTLTVNFRGCEDSLRLDSLIYINAPISKFTPATTLFCNPSGLPVTLNVTDEATHGVLSDDVYMIWQWGDGTPNTVLDDPDLDDADLGSTTHNFANYGSYTIKQVIYNYTTGCSDSTTNVIDVSTVTAAFTMANDSICQGDSLLLFDNSSTWLTPPTPHPLDTWEYAMGNGQTVSGDANGDAAYVYPQAGSYTITLTATNSVGCSATTTMPITVLALPFSVIAADASTGCSPFLVNFTNSSISLNGLGLASFDYSFTDDSTNITTTNINTPVSHTFHGDGIFYANLTATDVFGCQSLPATVPITITKPGAFFSIDNIICNGDSLFATNSSTGIAPLSYAWFVDGNPLSTNLNAAALIQETSISQNQTSATHVISLVVTDANGCKDTVGNLVTVSLPRAFPLDSLSGASVNQFGQYTCPPVFAFLKDSSFSFGAITNWSWSFGNGNTSPNQNPSATYVFAGTYDLKLEVTDEYGCKGDTTIVDFVTIGGPEATASVTQNAGICAQGAYFQLLDTSNISSITWNMGDQNTVLDTVAFLYNYTNPGTYTASVTIADDLGCVVVYPLNPVTVVDDNLTADFNINPNPAKQDANVLFSDQSVSPGSPVVYWQWDFGNGQAASSSTTGNQTISYPTSGYYNVTLTVTSSIGCTDTHTEQIFIQDPDTWVPNVFTPNGDGANDLFTLYHDWFSDYHIVILNRWGSVVWEKDKDPANPILLWDGTNNGGAMCTDGVYFYHLTGKMYGGTDVDKEGFVTLRESH